MSSPVIYVSRQGHRHRRTQVLINAALDWQTVTARSSPRDYDNEGRIQVRRNLLPFKFWFLLGFPSLYLEKVENPKVWVSAQKVFFKNSPFLGGVPSRILDGGSRPSPGGDAHGLSYINILESFFFIPALIFFISGACPATFFHLHKISEIVQPLIISASLIWEICDH